MFSGIEKMLVIKLVSIKILCVLFIDIKGIARFFLGVLLFVCKLKCIFLKCLGFLLLEKVYLIKV